MVHCFFWGEGSGVTAVCVAQFGAGPGLRCYSEREGEARTSPSGIAWSRVNVRRSKEAEDGSA